MKIRKVVSSYAIGILNSTICLMQYEDVHQILMKHFSNPNKVTHTLTDG